MVEKIGVEISESCGGSVVCFKGTSLSDTEGILTVWKRIKDFLREKEPKRVVVDFSEVKFFSSQVLGVLVDMRSFVQSYGGEVVISSIEPQLYRVFKITNLSKIFRFFADRESALGGADSR